MEESGPHVDTAPSTAAASTAATAGPTGPLSATAAAVQGFIPHYWREEGAGETNRGNEKGNIW